MIKAQISALGACLFPAYPKIPVKKRNSNLLAYFQAEFFQGLVVLVTAGQKRGGKNIKAACFRGQSNFFQTVPPTEETPTSFALSSDQFGKKTGKIRRLHQPGYPEILKQKTGGHQPPLVFRVRMDIRIIPITG